MVSARTDRRGQVIAFLFHIQKVVSLILCAGSGCPVSYILWLSLRLCTQILGYFREIDHT